MNAVDRPDQHERQAAVSRLRKLISHFDGGEPLTEDDRDFFANAIEEYLANSLWMTLDQAFGLRSRGGPSVRAVVLNEERDKLLRHLVRDHDRWSLLTPRLAARQVRTAFSKYEASRWLTERRQKNAPLSEPDATFWRILKLGARMPQEKRLSQIVDLEIQYPV